MAAPRPAAHTGPAYRAPPRPGPLRARASPPPARLRGSAPGACTCGPLRAHVPAAPAPAAGRARGAPWRRRPAAAPCKAPRRCPGGAAPPAVRWRALGERGGAGRRGGAAAAAGPRGRRVGPAGEAGLCFRSRRTRGELKPGSGRCLGQRHPGTARRCCQRLAELGLRGPATGLGELEGWVSPALPPAAWLPP